MNVYKYSPMKLHIPKHTALEISEFRPLVTRLPLSWRLRSRLDRVCARLTFVRGEGRSRRSSQSNSDYVERSLNTVAKRPKASKTT